jgi:hypothetical protein
LVNASRENSPHWLLLKERARLIDLFQGELTSLVADYGKSSSDWLMLLERIHLIDFCMLMERARLIG